MINPALTIRTGRLVLTPVGGADLPDLRAIKADPQVFAVMLGGVRNHAQTAERPRAGRDRLGPARLRHLGGPRASTAALPAITGLDSIATTAAAWRCVSRYGPRRRAAASRGRRRLLRYGSATSRAPAAHRRGRAGKQFRLPHGSRRHRHA